MKKEIIRKINELDKIVILKKIRNYLIIKDNDLIISVFDEY